MTTTPDQTRETMPAQTPSASSCKTISSALFDLAATAGGHTCTFADNAGGPFECDIAPIVQAALDEGRDFAQLRLRFDLAGDNDGTQDLALFFITDSNTNEPGIFEVEVDVVAE